MIPYSFLPEAVDELREAAEFYEEQRAGLAEKFRRAVEAAIRRIQEHPLMYRQIESGCRQCRVTGFPYGLIYRLRDKKIEIMVVMHLSRNPGYWKHRIN
ncbi:MAG: type II toxin-antitoxin system RelE/ParE family toxin [Candidatus Hydrogenedentes bacterium]|nr:type II toxin-antitoxin system RelE/ParE family toxin [Candidatus Hydrogenedentota bacterium]